MTYILNMGITLPVFAKVTQNSIAIKEYYLLGYDIDYVVWYMFDILEEHNVSVFRVKTSVNYTSLHGITSQNVVHTTVSAVRTLNTTCFHCLHSCE
jgi:hypothetical protein